MSYFIFLKNSEDLNGSIYKIAENEFDLNNLNIIKLDYKIIEDSQINFDAVKYGNKVVNKYDNDIITYNDQSVLFANKEMLQDYITNYKVEIKQFTDNNANHPLYSRWNDYYIQLNNLNLNSIQYPLNMSLEQYFKDQNQTSLNPLQLP